MTKTPGESAAGDRRLNPPLSRGDHDGAMSIITTDLRRLVYVSAAKMLFSDDDLTALLADARRRNQARNVTGMLIYHGGNFMQAVEGAPDAIDALMSSIRRDPRHFKVITIVDMKDSKRDFADWAMAFRNVKAMDANAGAVAELALNSSAIRQRFDDQTLAKQILKTFHACLS
jgi:hypothetical protein